MKIIILKRDKLGDLILTTPMLQLLKQKLPMSTIAVIAPQSSAWILNDAPFIDELYSYPQVKFYNLKSIICFFKQLIMFLKIRAACFDFAIVAGGEFSHRAVKRILWIKAKRTISFVPKNRMVSGITDPIIEPNSKQKSPHEALRMVELIRPILQFKNKLNLPLPYFRPSQNWLKKAEAFLSQKKINKQKFIVFGLGARREKKQASKEQIIETANYVYNKYNMKTILVWTPGPKNNRDYPGDDELAYEILNDAPNQIIPLRAPLDLTIGVIWLAKKSIFPDSGLMHFAAASPGGVIGLFAETNISPHPSQWGPLGSNSIYIEAEKTIKELGVNFLHQELNKL